MTQRDRILKMLQEAGERGIRSDAFFEAYMPRAAARVRDLRDQGHEISSEREGRFVRYVLHDERRPGGITAEAGGAGPGHSSQRLDVPEDEPSLFSPARQTLGPYDPDAEWAA